VITLSQLFLEADIPGISNEQFQLIAAGAKVNCPVSKAYNMHITLDATMLPHKV
jgi:lipoyl-dependent peroxiredoxin